MFMSALKVIIIPVKPFNNYGLSKLGGDCSLYKNSLILRITMTDKPFAYKKAFFYSNYMFHEDMVEILPKLINEFGIINVGFKILIILGKILIKIF